MVTAALALGAMAPAASASTPTSPDSADVETLRQQLDDLATGHVGETTPGAMVAVVDAGGPVLTETWGLADPVTQTALTPESRTPVASVSKVVTALTALTLHHEGLLDLDADIRESLPVRDERDAAARHPVTGRQLLTHHSGIVESLLFHPDPIHAPHTGTLLDALEEHPPTLRLPGAGLHYSPMQAYALLGAAIEQATGDSFDDAVERWVLEPAGATTADFHGPGTQPGDVVLTTRDGEGWAPTRWPAVIERPAASLTWSATDAAALLHALLDPAGALPAEVVEEAMTTAVRPNHGAGGHTQVFFEEWRGDVRVLEHAGANGLAWFAVVPEAGIGVFTAVTTEDADAAPLTSEVLDTVAAWTAQVGLASAQPPPAGGLAAVEPDWVAPTEPATPVGTFHERLFGPRGPELPLRSLISQVSVSEDGEDLLLADRRFAPAGTDGRWCDDAGCIAGARAADGTVLLLRGERGMLEQTLVPAPWWANLWFVTAAVAGALVLAVVAVTGSLRARWRRRRDRTVPAAVSRPTGVAWSVGTLLLVVGTPSLTMSPLLANSSAWLDAGGPLVWTLRLVTAGVLALGVVWLVQAVRRWRALARARQVAAVPAVLIGLATSIVLVTWALPAV